MKITLRPEGATDSSTDVVLADGADRAADNVRGPASGSISVSIDVQEIKAIRAENAKYVSRKNRAGSYSFRASRRFERISDASCWILTHGMTCPTSGTLIFDCGMNTVHMTGCVIRQIGEMEQTGCHVKTAYSINYSAVSVILMDPIRVNCGGSALTGWITDDGLYSGSGGTSFTEHDITNVTPGYVGAIYQTLRWGANLVYSFNIPDGVYNLKFHWAEIGYDNVGDRIFKVIVNGQESGNLDVFASVAGVKYKALFWLWPLDVVVSGTGLTVSFVNIVGGAMCCGIEVIPLSTNL